MATLSDPTAVTGGSRGSRGLTSTSPAAGGKTTGVRADRRRTASEVPWITGVRLAPGGEGQLINISRVGALVGSKTRLVPGTSVNVWFAGIPGQDPLTAGVVRCEVAAIGRDGKLLYQSGIAFGQILELDVSAGGPAGKPQGFLEQRGAEAHDWQARLRAAEARCQELDERHAAERREWEMRLQVAEARYQELGEEHQADRGKWEAALRAAEAGLEDLAAQQAREHADLERALLEAEAECHRLKEEHVAARDRWEHALREAETQRQQLIEQRLTEGAEWQEKLCEAEARHAQLLERHRAAQTELEKQVEEANERRRLLEQYAADRAEWERALQDAERRREAESADHRGECDRLGEALGEIRSRCRWLVDHAPYPAYVCDADGKCLRANGALLQLLGHTSEADPGALSFLEDVYTSADDAKVVAARSRHPDEVASVEVEWQRKDGVKLTVQLSRRRLVGDPETPDATEIIVNDVTRLRALEGQARRYAALETTMVELTQATRGLQERLTAFLRGVDEVKPGEG